MADSDGNVPLWDAMLGGHEHVIKLLTENGANLNSRDMGHFACTAAEQNDLELLKEIVRHGRVITETRKNGSTALHVAVYEDNIEIVRFLLDLAICLLMVQKL
ncbi:potassium channel AKT1-like [Pistacia vera]|uniref:potassium channel AKT1-like n=1 Tax=Pistacia vera TaxID=55513 RepID=UPI001262BA96|nr:potassium channel AKT1-like [Pistacia vera]